MLNKRLVYSNWREDLIAQPAWLTPTEKVMAKTVNSCEIEIRVRYSEVDRMGAVHHSRYWVYFEMGRTELLRQGGAPYSRIEADGVFFVVARCSARYRASAHYDDLLVLKTQLSKISAASLEHKYELKRASDGLLLATAETILACVDRQGRVIPIPVFLRGEV